MTKNEALRLALEALEVEQTVYLRTKLPVPEYLTKAITAIKKALETKEYEQGFIDGMQKQMQSSVDKAVNAMGKRGWVGLSNGEMIALSEMQLGSWDLILEVEARLKEKNGY